MTRARRTSDRAGTAALAAGLATALVAALVSSCGGRSAAPKAPFSALWIGAESSPPGGEELAGLARAGIDELFLDAARLSWEGGAPRLHERPAPALGRSMPATLVIEGPWRRPEERVAAIADAWRGVVAELTLAAERRRAAPIGLHLALEIAGGESELAALLRRLRRDLGPALRLSVELAADRLDPDAIRDLADAVDFVVVFAYGHGPDRPDDPGAWDPERIDEAIAALDALGRPYALGAWSVGSARHRTAGGEARGDVRTLELGPLLRGPALDPRPGAIFESLGRQVFELVARQPVRIGDARLARGDTLRVARPNTADLERFLAAAAPAPGSPRLGTVLRRAAAAGESLASSTANLIAALAPGAAAPQLEVRVERLPPARGRQRLRVLLANRGEEPTDYGTVEANYLELRLAAGAIAGADDGDFVAWEQLWHGEERRTLRALRQADTLRLYAGYVGGGETLASGPIEVRGAPGLDRVTIGGTFLVPGGRELALPPRSVTIENPGDSGRRPR
jgi:hypothetical protein